MMTTGLKDVTGDVLYQGHRAVVVLWTRFCLIRYSVLQVSAIVIDLCI